MTGEPDRFATKDDKGFSILEDVEAAPLEEEQEEEQTVGEVAYDCAMWRGWKTSYRKVDPHSKVLEKHCDRLAMKADNLEGKVRQVSLFIIIVDSCCISTILRCKRFELQKF